MTKLIPLDAVIAALDRHAHGTTTLGGQTYRSITLGVAVDAIRALPTIDPAAIRDAAPEPMYLICKYGMYYRPNCQGYTSSTAEAGRYTLAEAEEETHPNGPDGPRDGMSYIPAPADLAAVQPAPKALHRSFQDAGDGRPMPPMGDELMIAGLSVDDARFVAVQLAQNGLTLTAQPDPRDEVIKGLIKAADGLIGYLIDKTESEIGRECRDQDLPVELRRVRAALAAAKAVPEATPESDIGIPISGDDGEIAF